jgi:feruloyl-CoA synthase
VTQPAPRLATTPFATPAVDVVRTGDGIIVRSRLALGRHPRCIGDLLEHWAREAPDRPFLLERSAGGGWRGLSYGEMLEQVRRVGTWLLGQNLSVERPVAILSENSVEHALLTLACLHVGIPAAPICPAYSLVSKDFAKLKAIIEILSPGLVYVSDHARFASALAAVRNCHDATIVLGSESAPDGGAVPFASLSSGCDAAAVARAFAAVTPHTIAKLMFTSGSTAEPKGAIITQHMLCSNQQALAQIVPFLTETPVLLDWLPWHHVFGGNHNFNIVLRNGGTLYIDHGRPLPGQFEQTLANLREVSPTLSLNVPRAYDMLVAALHDDPALRACFFRRMRLIMNAGASLPEHLWEELQTLARQWQHHHVVLTSCWGMTESAPTATACHAPPDHAAVIGLPIPECELKLVPNGEKLEARIRGPNVTPGYWRRPDLTAKFFDEEGFFRTGDAVRFVDPEHPERELLFDGRVTEDFKLSTATWVNVGALRLHALEALAPIAQDVVVAGHGRDEIGFLVFPKLVACRCVCQDLPSDAPPARVFEHPSVRACVEAGLSALQNTGGGSSTCARRALLLLEPPSIDAGEITDKGYINQGMVLTRRAALVETLFLNPIDPSVITLRGTDAPG